MFFYRTTGDIRVNIDDYWEQASVSAADSYFTARGITTWSGEDSEKTQALQRAWDYMKSLNWVDEVFSLAQPEDITNAHILLAHEELKSSGILTPTLTKEDFIQSKNIGGAIQKVYRADAPSRTRFSGIDRLLRPYLISNSNIKMERG